MEFFTRYEFWIWIFSWLGLISLLTFLFSLVAIPLLIARLPVDYFVRRPVRDWPGRHPLVHLFLVLAKNFLGLILLVAGTVMLLLPGQGLLTMLMGILLLDFPGKRRLERRLIGLPGVLSSANWIRKRAGAPPLRLDRDAGMDRQAQ